MIFNKGQVMTPALVAVAMISSIATTAGGWLVNRVLESPESQAAAVGLLQGKVDLLCNDYVNTISRMDQNIQNIARAIKATVVMGVANSNPCKTK